MPPRRMNYTTWSHLATASPRARAYVSIRVEADGFVQGKENVPRVPLVTEEGLYWGRRFLRVLARYSEDDVREKEEVSLPSIQGNTITDIDIVLDPAPEKASVPSDDDPSEASDRDDLVGWFKMTGSDTIIPVFKTEGTYYSVCRGFEIPFKKCPEGLEWAVTPSSMVGTKIGFDEALNAHYIAVMDSQLSHFSDGRGGIGEKEPMTRIDKPSGLLDPTVQSPRTNDDFLGWYHPVWFPWVRFEIRNDGERYFSQEQELQGPDEPAVWKSRVGPSELTPLPDGLGLAIGQRGKGSLIYNEALKRFEMTKPTSPVVRMPLARVPPPPSREGGAVPELRVEIGIPSWH